MLTYTLIFVTAILGLINQPWWLVLPCAGMIALTTTLQNKLSSNFIAVQRIELASYLIVTRLTLAIAAAASALMLGRLSGYLCKF